MKTLGFIFAAIGVIVAICSLLMSTSVATTYSFESTGTSGVYNLGLLQTQLLLFISGCSATIVGSTMVIGGIVISALRASKVGGARSAGAATAEQIDDLSLPPFERSSEYTKAGPIEVKIALFGTAALLFFALLMYVLNRVPHVAS